MDFFEAGDSYIIKDGTNCLWCDRNSGRLEAKEGTSLLDVSNPKCLGTIKGIIGKFKILPESEEWYLIVIKESEVVGRYVSGEDIYQIQKVGIIPLSVKPSTDLDLPICPKHEHESKPIQLFSNNKVILKTFNSIKTVTDNVHKRRNHASKGERDKEKMERKIFEEIYRMYNVARCYYYSRSADLTQTLQHQRGAQYDSKKSLWARADDRFFWNKDMLSDLIQSQSPLADHWIMPIIQGFYQTQICTLDEMDPLSGNTGSTHERLSQAAPSSGKYPLIKYQLALLSRRSRYRAGTRYKRRGLDEEGHCANFVETEQFISYHSHTVSFVQTRGSIPVFWSQSGNKYRPPPVLEKSEPETEKAFKVHVESQFALYGSVVAVSLVERAGREKVVGDAYLRQVIKANFPNFEFISFDFHEYCRGLQFDNVALLLEVLEESLKNMKYCWVSNEDGALISAQEGVFRTNCIDCLDRTNVVQMAIARIVLSTQVRKLGLLTPDDNLPSSCQLAFNHMWAGNGDAISQQYAGTAALKGDYTRTGERKFSGLMKDGVKSANRYLMQRFRDLNRQAAIDLQVGQPLEEEVLTLLRGGEDEADGGGGTRNERDKAYLFDKASSVTAIVDEARSLLVVDPTPCLGGWALIGQDQSGGDDQSEVDSILLLSPDCLYIVSYDEELDSLRYYEELDLKNIYTINIGAASGFSKSKILCLRVWFRYESHPGYFHTFKLPAHRIFNNTLVGVESPEEVRELLKAIASAIKLTAERRDDCAINVTESKLQSKPHRPTAKLSLHDGVIPESLLVRSSQKVASIASNAVSKTVSNMKRHLASWKKRPTGGGGRKGSGSGIVAAFTRHHSDEEIEDGDMWGHIDPTSGGETVVVDQPVGGSLTVDLSSLSCGVHHTTAPDLIRLDERDSDEDRITTEHSSSPTKEFKADVTGPLSNHDQNDDMNESVDTDTDVVNGDYVMVRSERANPVSDVGHPAVTDRRSQLKSRLLRTSFSDDTIMYFGCHQPTEKDQAVGGAEMDGKVTEGTHAAGGREFITSTGGLGLDGKTSALSRLRSGLSTVQQMIVRGGGGGRPHSPMQQRRRLALEAHLHSNLDKSHSQFQHLRSRVLIL